MRLRTKLTATFACAALAASTACGGDDGPIATTDTGVGNRDGVATDSQDVNSVSDTASDARLDTLGAVSAEAGGADTRIDATVSDTAADTQDADDDSPSANAPDGHLDVGTSDTHSAGDADTDADVAVASFDLVKRPKPSCPGVAGAARAKKILFFLGDGMGIPVLTAARIYSVGEDGQLTIDTLPETAFIRTYSNDALVTDSAPSMSAYLTGVKMNNDVIAMTPDTKFDKGSSPGTGKPVQTLLELAEAAGYHTGVVTTTRVTHATPAAAYSHISNRDDEQAIAAQLTPGNPGYNGNLGDGLEVVLGGGFLQFQGSSRADRRDLLSALRSNRYTVVGDVGSFRALSGNTLPDRLVGLFSTGHMAYEADRDNNKEPSLAEMTSKAIDVLDKGNSSWFLMVEGGRIDHALHDSNAYRALTDTKAFDEAIKLALTKVDLTNTIVVVTADHDHTMIHHGYAARRPHGAAGNSDVLGLVRSYRPAPDAGPFELDQEKKEYTVLGFVNGQNRPANGRQSLVNSVPNDAGQLPDPESTVRSKDYRQESAIRMPAGSETHGGQDVALFAAGVGSGQFHGIMTNTEVFDVLRCASGL